jgi:hypothetical protein
MLQERKIRIEERLEKHGIDCQINYPEYLTFDDHLFATPYEVGCRIMILYAIAYTLQDEPKKPGIVKWLKDEGLWSYVSRKEAAYFEHIYTREDLLLELSWKIESAYILAWSVKLVKDPSFPSDETNQEQMDDFVNHLPALGDHLNDFLHSLSFRDTAEIFDENIFYELTTTYFRDLLFSGRKDQTDINKPASFERHLALNWLRRFKGVKDWDHTDTSTPDD